MRSEVKERCNIATMGSFLVLGSSEAIAEHVRQQLSRYTYTFPPARLVVNSPPGLVMRSRPYRNPHIITLIRDMYFSGGATSFARRFAYLFPEHEDTDGETLYEVPVPMVALVATGVSRFFFGYVLCSYLPAVCVNSRVAYRRTANHGVLIKCVHRCLPGPCQYFEAYSGEASRCLSPHDVRHLYKGIVSCSFY